MVRFFPQEENKKKQVSNAKVDNMDIPKVPNPYLADVFPAERMPKPTTDDLNTRWEAAAHPFETPHEAEHLQDKNPTYRTIYMPPQHVIDFAGRKGRTVQDYYSLNESAMPYLRPTGMTVPDALRRLDHGPRFPNGFPVGYPIQMIPKHHERQELGPVLKENPALEKEREAKWVALYQKNRTRTEQIAEMEVAKAYAMDLEDAMREGVTMEDWLRDDEDYEGPEPIGTKHIVAAPSSVGAINFRLSLAAGMLVATGSRAEQELLHAEKRRAQVQKQTTPMVPPRPIAPRFGKKKEAVTEPLKSSSTAVAEDEETQWEDEEHTLTSSEDSSYVDSSDYSDYSNPEEEWNRPTRRGPTPPRKHSKVSTHSNKLSPLSTNPASDTSAASYTHDVVYDVSRKSAAKSAPTKKTDAINQGRRVSFGPLPKRPASLKQPNPRMPAPGTSWLLSPTPTRSMHPIAIHAPHESRFGSDPSSSLLNSPPRRSPTPAPLESQLRAATALQTPRASVEGPETKVLKVKTAKQAREGVTMSWDGRAEAKAVIDKPLASRFGRWKARIGFATR